MEYTVRSEKPVVLSWDIHTKWKLLKLVQRWPVSIFVNIVNMNTV